MNASENKVSSREGRLFSRGRALEGLEKTGHWHSLSCHSLMGWLSELDIERPRLFSKANRDTMAGGCFTVGLANEIRVKN